MSRRQQPSLGCVVREAPSNCPEFQALCDALQRNDPTVTTVTTDRSTTPEGYGRQLGEALLSNNNSVVSEIDLYLSFLLSESDRQGASSAAPLATWMEHSSSLRTVTLRAKYETRYDRYFRIDPDLLQRLVNAMKKNPSIQVFHSYAYSFPVEPLTEYLSTATVVSKLQSLKIDIRSAVTSDLEQAAQTIAALSGLKELSLACSIELLKLLPAHSTVLLRDLNVDFRPWILAEASDMTLFSSILSSSKALQRVTMEGATFNRVSWEVVRSGLQSNPSIAFLNLHASRIAPVTRPLILNHMQSSDVDARQNIRSLELSCSDIMHLCTGRDLSRLAQMVCGSLLEHVTFALQGLAEHAVAEFFEVLSANSSAVRLRSMHLTGRLLWDMTAYLSSTVHLRHLAFTFEPGEGGNDEFAIPAIFLRSLRRNGSLHTVEFKDRYGQSYTPSDDVSRFIAACTTRNRELSNVIKSSFPATAGAEINVRSGIDETGKNHFPTQCLTSQQAPATAPNATLQGLLASLDTLGSTITSGCLQGKRSAAEALGDL